MGRMGSRLALLELRVAIMNPNVSPSADVSSSASSSHERHAQRRRVEIFSRIPTAAITSLGGSLTRRILAMQPRLLMKMVPCMVVTLVIAQWNGALLGTASLQTIVITFAWAAAVVHQFLASRPTEPVQRFSRSPDLIVSALGGQILWVLLPLVQLAHPGAWYSVLLTIPSALTATGAILALYWTLHPFVMGLRTRNATARRSEFDGPVLYGSFFLLSGHLIFAAGACASVISLLASRIKWAEVTREWFGCGVVLCRLES